MTSLLTSLQLSQAEVKWGHPIDWPRPFPKKPRWWQYRRRRYERPLIEIFGELTQSQRDAFYIELHQFQAIDEDAGGYLHRCYRSMSQYG